MSTTRTLRSPAKRPSASSAAQVSGATRHGSARERLFRTASELFYRKGIRAVGVETIAAQAQTTKMSLYRNFPSKDVLVAQWLSAHDAQFWRQWDAVTGRCAGDPARQLKAAFAMLARHVAEPQARGCPLANAAVELTEKDHPARRVIEAHKAKLRARLGALCSAMGARHPRLLTDQLFLLMEGAQIGAQIPGARDAARRVARAAAALIDTQRVGRVAASQAKRGMR